MIRYIFKSLALTAAMLLISCGGSGGSQVSGIDGSGAPVATSTTGTIDGFGSVIVNGVRYNSDKAQILINGEVTTEESLRVGYQVSLIGSIASDGSATAEKIEFIPTLVGSVTAKTGSTLVVMGNRVKVDNDTLFDVSIKPRNIQGITLGTHILVSGALAADGSIKATRVDLANNGQQQLLGFVRELDPMNMTFLLNQQRVSYAAAAINLGNQPLRNGLLVSVRGELSEDQSLQASQIQRVATEFAATIKSASIEGYITRFNSVTDFDVAGINITTNSQTRYDNGEAKNLAESIRVEVKGNIDSAGKLLATEIEFERKINHKLEGTVSSITLNNTSGSGIATGTLQVDGISIRTTLGTRYEDKGSSRIKRFNLSSLQPGDLVEVTGYSSDLGFIATKIEREEPATNELREREVEGIVTSISGDSFTLFGRKIVTDVDTRYRSADGKPMSAAIFFMTALGKRVEVKGTPLGVDLLATDIEFDEED